MEISLRGNWADSDQPKSSGLSGVLTRASQKEIAALHIEAATSVLNGMEAKGLSRRLNGNRRTFHIFPHKGEAAAATGHGSIPEH